MEGFIMVKKMMFVFTMIVGFSGTVECMHKNHAQNNISVLSHSNPGLLGLLKVMAFGCIIAPRSLVNCRSVYACKELPIKKQAHCIFQALDELNRQAREKHKEALKVQDEQSMEDIVSEGEDCSVQ
jgi:hypothetical protein